MYMWKSWKFSQDKLLVLLNLYNVSINKIVLIVICSKMYCKVNYSSQRSISSIELVWSVRLLGLPLKLLTCVETASQLWTTVYKTSLLKSNWWCWFRFRARWLSGDLTVDRSTTWCLSVLFLYGIRWNWQLTFMNVFAIMSEIELHTFRKYLAPFQTKVNKRLHWAYILAGFAVQRERIEGLAVFSEIAVECFLLFTKNGELWRLRLNNSKFSLWCEDKYCPYVHFQSVINIHVVTMTWSSDGVIFRFCVQYYSSSRKSAVKEYDLETLNTNSMKTSISRLILEKDVFRVVTSVWQRKNSESRFRAPMLYSILRWARYITKFIWHASCILLRSGMSIASFFKFKS